MDITMVGIDYRDAGYQRKIQLYQKGTGGNHKAFEAVGRNFGLRSVVNM